MDRSFSQESTENKFSVRRFLRFLRKLLQSIKGARNTGNLIGEVNSVQSRQVTSKSLRQFNCTICNSSERKLTDFQTKNKINSCENWRKLTFN